MSARGDFLKRTMNAATSTKPLAVAPKVKAAPESLAVKSTPAPEPGVIDDWVWRNLDEVRSQLGNLTAIPKNVQDYGRFMLEKVKQANTSAGNSVRDLLKAYGITRSSIQRRAQLLATAEKGGLPLGQLGLDEVRPEGAFATWLGTPAGQAYLDAAQRGQVRGDALEDLRQKFQPFGFQNTLVDNLSWAAENLPQYGSRVADFVSGAAAGTSPAIDYTNFLRENVRGVSAAKAGFIGSLIGRGDLPTLDARQIIFNTGRPTSEAAQYMSRRKGQGAIAGVKRLSDRMAALDLKLPPDLEPFRQHLTHHTVWDKIGNETTTHADLMDAMRNYARGGRVSSLAVKPKRKR